MIITHIEIKVNLDADCPLLHPYNFQTFKSIITDYFVVYRALGVSSN